MTTSTTRESLGLWGWDSFEFIVHDLERSQRFYTESMGLPLQAHSTAQHQSESGEETRIFGRAGIKIACITPTANGSRADRWLKRHPDGIAVMNLRVKNLEHTYRVLQSRPTTFSSGIVQVQDEQGKPYRYFEITTPLGDVRLRFVERSLETWLPGMTPVADKPTFEQPFQSIDHVTSNMLTLEPWISWLKEVMGFEEYWNVKFHTSDAKADGGSGLASTVMWDPESKIKLANNEPAAPNFERSQVYTFVEDNHGAGVQHIAFHIPQIEETVDTLRRRGVNFLGVPNSYYEMLPVRLQQQQVTNFTENIERLKELGVLVDGDDDKYLLQIFMQEAGMLYDEQQAGPFFYELIQRKGATLFGEGNFRALFEAIEREQQALKA